LSNSPLHRTFLTGFAWTSITKWLTQGITWFSVFYTARLLSPEDVGLASMAGFLGIVAQVLAEFGLGSAVMQMKQLKDRELGQLHVISMGLGLLSIAFCVAVAGWTAEFFHQPLLKELLIWNSLGFLVMAVQAVPQGLLQRDLDYRRLSLTEGWQALTQAVLLVVCALAGLRYWSFLVATISGRVVAAGLAWYWKPVPLGWPRWGEIQPVLRFGLEVSGARLSSSLALQADGLVIGRVMGEGPLGIYRMAINLASAPVEKVAQLLMRVTGPLFARLNDDRVEMGRYFFVLSDALVIVLAPLTVGFMVTMPEMVDVVLGEKWRGIVEPSRWLALYMSLRSLTSLAQQVVVSLGQTRFFFWTSLLNLVALPPAFYVAGQYSLEWVAAVWVITTPLLLLPQVWMALRQMQCSIRSYVRLLLPSLGCAVGMGLAVWGAREALPSAMASWQKLGVEVTVGGVVYAGLLWKVHGANLVRYYNIIMRK
jgi:teichuronic acid exporter